LYCFIVLLCICVVSCPYVIYCPTVMAQYSLFVLKVPLNPKQTLNKSVQRATWWSEERRFTLFIFIIYFKYLHMIESSKNNI